MKATTQWLEAETRLGNRCTIDALHQQRINDEKIRWHNVFQRLLAIVQFLAEHNMAFRGSSDKLHEPQNGNFLGLVQLIAKFDPVMQEHLRRMNDSEIHDHYLGKHIQNELVQLMGKKVKQTIIDRVKIAKYFSVILDCTPDISHKEQMSLAISMSLMAVQMSLWAYTNILLNLLLLRKAQEKICRMYSLQSF